MDWFRSWNGVSTDTKFLLIMRATGADGAQVGGIWQALMDHASSAKPRGSIRSFDPETFAAFAAMDSALVAAIFKAMGPEGALGRPMHDGQRLVAWADRQPVKADATASERVKRHREKKRAEKAASTPKPAPSPDDVTPCNGRSPLAVTGNGPEEKEQSKSSFSDASRQAPDFHTSLGNTSQHACVMKPGDVWAQLASAGVNIPFLKRRFGADHVRSWTESGITSEQLAEAIRRAQAARQRDRSSHPVNLGFLENFVVEVRTGLPAKTTDRSTGHDAVDAAAQQFLNRG